MRSLRVWFALLIVDRDGEIAVVGGQCDQTVDLLVIVEAVVDRGCIGEVSFVETSPFLWKGDCYGTCKTR